MLTAEELNHLEFLKRLFAQGLNFENKVAVKVAHKNIRNSSILEMAKL